MCTLVMVFVVVMFGQTLPADDEVVAGFVDLCVAVGGYRVLDGR